MGKNGGVRPGAGRPKGRKNKITVELQGAAREYTEEALRTLVYVMRHGESDQARIVAADKILDRGYGKPAQNGTLTIDDKRDATDWSTAELVAFINDAAASRDGSRRETPRGGEPDSVH